MQDFNFLFLQTINCCGNESEEINFGAFQDINVNDKNYNALKTEEIKSISIDKKSLSLNYSENEKIVPKKELVLKYNKEEKSRNNNQNHLQVGKKIRIRRKLKKFFRTFRKLGTKALDKKNATLRDTKENL